MHNWSIHPKFKTGETEKNNYFLSFPNENLNDYNKIIKDQNPSKLLRIEEVKKERKSNFIKYLLIPYSILISLLCIKYYYSSNFGNSEKNFKYEWSTDNRTLEVVNKNTKKISRFSIQKTLSLTSDNHVRYHRSVIGKQVTKNNRSTNKGRLLNLG